jgi:hypothetical protein
MEIKQLLLAEHSKRQNLIIVRLIGDSQQKFDQLLRIYLSGETLAAQRGAWAMSECVKAYPSLAEKHLKKILEHITQPELHQAIKRNGIRVFQFISIPDAISGMLAHVCFKFLHSPEESLAVRAISIKLLAGLCKQHPELTNKFTEVMRMLNENPAPAIAASLRWAHKELFKKKKDRDYSTGAAGSLFLR